MTSTVVRRGAPGPAVPSMLSVLARASSPAERIAGGWLRPGGDPLVAELRLACWTKRIAGDRPERVAELLAQRGLSIDQWHVGLGDVQAVAGGQLPGWALDAMTLIEAIGSEPGPHPVPRLGEIAGEGLPEWVDGDQPWRFHPGFRDWMAQAARDVGQWAASAPISAMAARDLVLDLARRQLMVSGPVLMEAAARRAEGDLLFARDPRTDWVNLWAVYPVLGRLLATVWRQWRETTAEMCQRIASDLPSICPGAEVSTFELSAGDQHSGGRGVARLRLSDGTSIFLKPRADGLHRALGAVLATVDAVGETLGLSPSRSLPEVTERDGYMWVREAPSGDSATSADGIDGGLDSGISAYFRRAGALLRVLQALGSSDLHHENFVPTAHLPMLVDLETAVAPGPMRIAPPEDVVEERLSDSPGPTSMVTSVIVGSPGLGTVDVGALAGPSAALTPYAVRTLLQGADGAELKSVRAMTKNGRALPTRDGHPVALRGYEQPLIDGFADVQHRLELLVDSDYLPDLQPEPAVRLVARPTSTYARLLAQSTAPAAMVDGVDREFVLERLYLATGTAPDGLIGCEVEAMRELDIPLFTVPFTRADLVSDRGVVLPDAMTEAPDSRTRRRLRAVTTRDDHVDHLRANLFVMDPDERAVACDEQSETEQPAIDRHELVTLLLDRAIEIGDGTLAWIGLEHDPNRNRWHYGKMSPGLTGQAGIALALATVAAGKSLPAGAVGTRTVSKADCAAAARAALLGSVLRIGSGNLGSADGFGGPAGVLYASAAAARLLDDSTLLDAARTLIVPSLRAARRNRPSMVIDGRAGAILALLQLPEDAAVADALSELAGLGDDIPEVDGPDRWSLSLPSRTFGAALAVRRLARARGGTDLPALPVAAGPGDRIAWVTEYPAAATNDQRPADDGLWTLLDDAHLAQARSRGAGSSDTGQRALGRIVSRRARTGRWAAPLLAPDSVLLSPIHGIAALAVLCTAAGPDVPIVRALT